MLTRMSLAATLAVFMAAGCASKGNDQNYRMLDEDHDRFETEPHSTADAFVAYGQLVDNTRRSTRISDSAREQARVFEGEAPLRTVREADPSLNGLDRSHWEPIEVKAHPHVLAVQPHYFEDYTTYASRPGRPTVPLNAPEQSLATLEPAEAENVSARNLFDLIAQPVEMAFDLAMLPIRMIVTPPWTNVAEETGGHGQTYFEGSEREPVPAGHNPYGLVADPQRATVRKLPDPTLDEHPTDPASDDATLMEAAEQEAIATEPME